LDKGNRIKREEIEFTEKKDKKEKKITGYDTLNIEMSTI